MVVGDLDSLSAETVEALEQKGVAVERHPPVKNETDIELALARAVREGADAVLLVGAVGDRLDQNAGESADFGARGLGRTGDARRGSTDGADCARR